MPIPRPPAIPEIKFEKAVREDGPVRVGLYGKSGTGKTFSALVLAMALAAGGLVLFINTERRRAKRYAHLFDFQIYELDTPFSSDHYHKAITAADKLNPAVIIVDSMSHEHEGEWGYRNWHDKIAAESKSKAADWQAWSPPAGSRDALIQLLDRTNAHLIICYRGKDKSKLEEVTKNGRKKTEIIDIGVQPIGGEDMVWGHDVTFEMRREGNGREGFGDPIKTHDDLNGFINYGRITAETGETLLKWSRGELSQTPAERTDRVNDWSALKTPEQFTEAAHKLNAEPKTRERGERKRALLEAATALEFDYDPQGKKFIDMSGTPF